MRCIADRGAVEDGLPLSSVLGGLIRHPVRHLVHRWNWKAALFSAVTRGLLFGLVNLGAGPLAGMMALVTEFFLRAATSGFYGAITQALSRARPAWAGTLCAIVLLPTVAHTAELVVHQAAGTPRLAASILSSIAVTAISTLFHTFAMRRGWLTVGPHSRPLADDVKALPGMILEFAAAVPRAIARLGRTREA